MPGPTTLPPELDPRRSTARRPRATPGLRALKWLAGLASFLVVTASGVGYAVVTYYDGQVGRFTIHLPGGSGPAATADGDAVNFLLVGSDTREGSGNDDYQARKGSASFVSGGRSDVTILMHIPPGKARASLISIPRDSYVVIPAFTDPDGRHHRAHKEKFNAAYAEGGVPLMVATVEQLSGLRIDHAVQVNFAGFTKIVNTLGGVTVCVGSRRHDAMSGDFLSAGTHELNGTEALAFVRDRDSFRDGDISRIKSQQYFLSVMLHKVLSAGTLANPLKLRALLGDVTDAITVDRDLDLLDFAERMKGIDLAHVTLQTLPFTTSSKRVSGVGSVVALDRDAVDALFASLRAGDRVKESAAPSPSSPPLIVPASRISVTVLNGAGVRGLAARTAGDLRDAGFGIETVGNATSPTGERTVVRYGPTRADSARTLAAAVPGAQPELDPAVGPNVVLVVGSGYSGAHPVEVTPAAPTSATPSGSGTPASTPITAAAVSCAP